MQTNQVTKKPTDGVSLRSVAHPPASFWMKLWCWWRQLTFPIRALWTTKTVEIELPTNITAIRDLLRPALRTSAARYPGKVFDLIVDHQTGGIDLLIGDGDGVRRRPFFSAAELKDRSYLMKFHLRVAELVE